MSEESRRNFITLNLNTKRRSRLKNILEIFCRFYFLCIRFKFQYDRRMPLHLPRRIETIIPYVPGKNVKAIHLDSNENPVGPSLKVQARLKSALGTLNRYPEGSASLLKTKISTHLNVGSSQLCIGNGSNELIDLLIRTYCDEGDSIAVPKLAFIAYKLSAATQGVTVVESEIDLNLRPNLNDLLTRVQTDEKIKLVFLANPNNPTGAYNNRAELEPFLSGVAKIRGGSVLVVLDYAYWEYVTAPDLPDPIPYLSFFPNLVVLHTFSKIHGLAALRIGYSISSAELAASLEKVRQPFNVNGLALLAAETALADRSFVTKAHLQNTEARQYFERECDKLGIPFYPTQGNFILIDTMKGFGKTGAELHQHCLQKGISIRPLNAYGLLNQVRVTLGTLPQLEKFVQALKN